jgi:nucleotide-binding universal stress UspA family protein
MSTLPQVRRIVVGVDGSAESVAALMWACREAAMREADVHAVLAVEAACHRVASYAGPRPVEPQASWGAARDVLRLAVKHAAECYPGISVGAEVAEGLAARVLLDRSAGADMLVLGRTFHGTEHHRGAGPVIRACLRTAACPVVVIGLAETLAQPSGAEPDAEGADDMSAALQRVLAASGSGVSG